MSAHTSTLFMNSINGLVNFAIALRVRVKMFESDFICGEAFSFGWTFRQGCASCVSFFQCKAEHGVCSRSNKSALAGKVRIGVMWICADLHQSIFLVIMCK